MTTYLTDSEGKFIPASQRPDGTWRKARRVRDGYVPQEEVPLYESKGKQWAKKPDLPPGMCPIVAQQMKEKRERELKKKSKTNPAPGVIVLPTGKSAASGKATPIPKEKSPSKVAQAKPVQFQEEVTKVAEAVENLDLDEKTELAKKLKKLKKKIREIEVIEAKLKSGELKKPEKDQLDKVKRKKQILGEIKELEGQK